MLDVTMYVVCSLLTVFAIALYSQIGLALYKVRKSTDDEVYAITRKNRVVAYSIATIFFAAIVVMVFTLF